MYRFIFIALVLTCSLTASVYGQSASTEQRALIEQIEAYLAEDTFKNAIWAAKIINLESGETLYERNQEISLMPASNAKLYTSAAVLDILGPSFRYETTVYSDGPIEQGVLKGNLIIRGTGDPSIGGRYNKEDDPKQSLRQLARDLRSAGIRVVEGDIIGDDDLFEDAPLGIGWSWDDEPYYYSAEIGALTFYDNSVQIILRGQRPGMPTNVSWLPKTSYVTVNNKSLTVPADSSKDSEFARIRNTNAIDVLSEIPAGVIDTSYITISNPTLYFGHLFRDVLVEEGIAVQGAVLDVDDLANQPRYEMRRYRKQATLTSPPLEQLVETLNKESQNLYAELFIRTLGVHHPVNDPDVEPGSAEMGLKAAMATFARAQIDTSRIQLVDGSGLSRMNLVTADMTANLLSYMWNHPYATVRQAFYNSLPIGGVDGTLEDRFRSGTGFRNVRAKTGTLTGASSLSGYVFSKAETPYLFVLMCSNYTVKTREVRRTQDQIINLLSQYSE
ncbi:MAG: D-alanyl-D-alanine carboxypeptidase/D-alanyl-D-alanine-endopeptidase [Rhodothermaceae bacterium]|nr:D-alanyl-D-alanine carboxypeptidase/D-alanyl-D-alanine-endopeptidase [Rhodothermaceae bacterium]